MIQSRYLVLSILTVSLLAGIIGASMTASIVGTRVGSTVVINTIVVGGTPPYSYEYDIYSAQNNTRFLDVNIFSNSLIWTIPGSLSGTSIYANAIITDSASNVAVAKSTNSIFLGIKNTSAKLTVIGLPPGANIPLQIQNPLGVYHTINYPITNWTTVLNISYNTSLANTYLGRIPYQFQGAGTTLTYHGTTYTINEVNPLFTGFIMNTIGPSYLPFYAYFNQTQWNAQQANELISIGVSANSPIIIALIGSSNTVVPYGTSVQGNVVSAGSVKNYATYNAVNGTINFISTNVIKASPPLTININGQTITKPGSYQIPVAIINGKVGLSGKTYYWLNGSVSSSVLPGNKQNYSYSIKLSNGITLASSNTLANSISSSFSYKINEYVSANVTLDAWGNSNYTSLDPSGVTFPSNVLYYSNLTIYNTQSSPLTANTQIAITLDAGSFKSYEAANMMNVEFFNTSTGVVLNSWLEGNVLNERQTSNLYTSNNLLYWVLYPQGIQASTTVANAVAVGFLGTTNDIFSNTGPTGTAPQLSSSYGAVDNGNTVFNFYDNFIGTTISGSWSNVGTLSYSVNNGITFHYSTPGPWYYIQNSYHLIAPNVIDALENPNNTGNSGFGYIYNSGPSFQINSGSWTLDNLYVGGAVGGSYENSWFVLSGNDTSNGGLFANYVSKYAHTIATTNTGISIGQYENSGHEYQVQWIRTREYPPNGVMPTITFGPLYASYTSPTVSITSTPALSATLDQGQTITFNAAVTGGTAPFTYNYLLTNTITGLIVANQLYPSVNSATNSFVWTTANPIQTLKANVVVTDAHPTTANSPFIQTLTVDTALVANPPTPTTGILDNGQSITLTANPSGGDPGYTYQWYTNSGPGCLSLSIIGGATSSTYAASPTSNTYYCYIVTDSATIPSLATSSGSANIVVYTTPTVSITAGNTIVDSGQWVTFTASISGGTGTFGTYNFIAFNSFAPYILLGNQLGSGSGFGIQTNSLWVTNSPVKGNVIVTDTGTTSPFVFNSPKSASITINTAMTANNLLESNTAITVGGNSILTAGVVGGTSGYLFNWFSQASCAGSSFASGLTNTVLPIVSTTYSFNVVDSASTNAVICSASNTVTVAGAKVNAGSNITIIFQNQTTNVITSGQPNITVSTPGWWNGVTWVGGNAGALTGNFFIFKLDSNGKKMYMNGTYLQGNALVPYYSSSGLINRQYCLSTGTYWLEWNFTGNANYNPFDENMILIQQINQSGCNSHSGGLGGGTPGFTSTTTTTVPQTPSNSLTSNGIQSFQIACPAIPSNDVTAIASSILGCQAQYGNSSLSLPFAIIVIVGLALVGNYAYAQNARKRQVNNRNKRPKTGA